jgi:hypothetical protein
VAIAGVEVVEVRISHLAHATEIARQCFAASRRMLLSRLGSGSFEAR